MLLSTNTLGWSFVAFTAASVILAITGVLTGYNPMIISGAILETGTLITFGALMFLRADDTDTIVLLDDEDDDDGNGGFIRYG